MQPNLLETRGHTAGDGTLHLDLDVGVADVDVTIIIRIAPALSAKVDANGWPIGFFDQVAGSMPELERGSQGEFEERLPLE